MSANGHISVVDDDEDVRDLLSLLLRVEGFDVTTFASGQSLLDGLAELGPGCVVMDIFMPGIDGASVQRLLARSRPDLAVILMSGEGDISIAVSALKNGAIDFFEKPFDPDALVQSIRHALATVIAVIGCNEAAARIASLTAREREVLDRLVAGDTSKEMARRFNGSPRTVDIHRAHVLSKLGARNVAVAVRMAMLANIP